MVQTEWDERFNSENEFGLERVSFYTGEKYASNKLKGKYVCSRCSHPLYSSEQKFVPEDSLLSEFPTFRAPLTENDSITIRKDLSFGLDRKEVLCKQCGLHLGHLFEDGKSCGDKHEKALNRYSLLSLSLFFVPESDDQARQLQNESQQARTPVEVWENLHAQDLAAENFFAQGIEIEEVPIPPPTQPEPEPPKVETPVQPTPEPEPPKVDQSRALRTRPGAGKDSKPTKTETKTQEFTLDNIIPPKSGTKSKPRSISPTVWTPPNFIVLPLIFGIIGSALIYAAFTVEGPKK